MAQTKDKHYWSQLRSALSAGNWDVAFPGRAPKGTPLSWTELLRKFNKHCTGYVDVAELASQTQALSLLLNTQDEDQPSQSPLYLGDECVLPPERVEEATAGYAVLQSLRTAAKDPVKLALAYYAFALARPSECLSILDGIPELADVSMRVSSYDTLHHDGGALKPPDPSASTSRSGSFVSAWSNGTTGDATDGRMWGMIECVRSIALQGMSIERLSPDDFQKALSAYSTAIPLVNAVVAELQSSLNTGGTHAATFSRFRELWRWTERILRRAIILSSRICDLSKQDEQDQSVWTLFGLYRACSAYWPPTFRPRLRSSVATLHAQAFILRARVLPPDVLKVRAPRWISPARSVLQEFRTLLNVCTRFPRAGERNERVEDFVDLCVAIWEADGAAGENASWVIDFLWWATRLTFNSFRVYRHMTRLLATSGDRELAKRTLRLYIQVISKAREASTSGDNSTLYSEPGSDFDTDRHWVQTLVQGSRMFCRLAVEEVDYGRAVQLAKEAGTILQQARLRLDEDDKELVASVHLAEGIWHSVTAYAELNPKTRLDRLSQSLQSLRISVGTFPSAAAHHHLALGLCRPGDSKDMQGAMEHARAAVELDSNESRHWHLLGLLLAATGDWKAAKGVLEVGIDLAEADLLEDDTQTQTETNEYNEGGAINIRDFAQSRHVTTDEETALANGHANPAENDEHVPKPVLSPDATHIPPSASLLDPIGDRPRATRQERFEYALQMRMTQIALTEFAEGVENVSGKWLEVFAWFRDKRPASMDDRRKSIDSRRLSQDTRPSDIASIRTQLPRISVDAPRSENAVSEHGSDELTAVPIPITITPATPGIQNEEGNPSRSSIGHQDMNGEKRSTSLDEKDRDMSRGKKVREVLKSGVHKGQARITTISKKIGHGVGRHSSLNLKRISSAPDFHSVLSHAPYQASSIHLRQHHSIHTSQQDLGLLEVPPPPRASSPDPSSRRQTNSRASKDSRLLSDLWLMSAAIFRRQGQIEQVRGAIQEAEVRDEDNPSVWVQLGLYHAAMNDDYRAAESFRKALFIRPDDVAATVYLCQIYLTPETAVKEAEDKHIDEQKVDLAAGLLSDLTHGRGWDVPEAWYYLAKAYKLQGRRDRERECLNFALTLSETRGIRDVTSAVGWCL